MNWNLSYYVLITAAFIAGNISMTGIMMIYFKKKKKSESEDNTNGS